MKFNKELLKQDIKQAFIPIVVVIAVIAIANALFGRICPSRFLLGIPCPGCGLTRAFVLLLQGKIVEATIMHPYWAAVVIVAIVAFLYRYCLSNYEFWQKRSKLLQMCAIIIFISAIIFYVYRMVELFPNQVPMIYEKDNMLNNFIQRYF